MPGNFESLPFTVSVKPSELRKYGGNCGANCYLTMPFNKHARIEIENQGENPYIQVRPFVLIRYIPVCCTLSPFA